MLNEEVLRRALRQAELPDGSAVYAEELPSTNATALELAADGAPEWTLVAAGLQTAGRGRLGRTWDSPPEGGLTFSFVLRPALPPQETAILTLLAGWAATSACSEAGVSTAVRCKWPNDLLLGDSKVGGILAEARVTEDRLDHLVVGVGLNLGGAPHVEGAGALPPGDRGVLLASFLAAFSSLYRRGAGRTLADRVLTRYRAVCATLGHRVRADVGGGETIEGIAGDLDERGALLVRTAAGPVSVGFGEVLHLRS